MDKPIVRPEPLTREAFRPFGDVLHPGDEAPDMDLGIYHYWDRMARLEFSGDPVDLAYLRVMQREPILEKMERHRRASQSFIPLTDEPCIFALAPADAPLAGSGPDPARVRAFLLDGTAGVSLLPGTWHWSIFPLAPSADFVMVVRRNTVVDDLEVVDLEFPIEIRT